MQHQKSISILGKILGMTVDSTRQNSGLQPIGIGELLRCITGKVVVTHFRTEKLTLVGSLQIFAGQEAGYESNACDI